MRRLATLVAVVACLALPASASALVALPFGYLGKWGGSGSAATRLDRPIGVSVDVRQFVHVVDQANVRTQLFAGAGGFLSTFGRGVNGGTVFEECETGCRAGTPNTAAGDLSTGATGIGQEAGMNGPTFVADTGNDRVEAFNPDGSPNATIGTGSGPGAGQMSHPTGVAVRADGSIYVADQGNRRIDQFASNGSFVRAWGKNVNSGGGAGAETCTTIVDCQAGEAGVSGGEFEKPVDLATDSAQNVYVTDEQNQVVQRFDKDGNFQAMWGKNVDGAGAHVCTASCTGGAVGASEREFYNPEGIGIGGDRVFVVDSVNNRVQQFGTDGSFVRTFGWGVGGGSGFQVCTGTCHAGVAGSGDGQFSSPQRVGVDPSGNPYVSDTGNNRIERFGLIRLAQSAGELAGLLTTGSAYDAVLVQPGTYKLSGPISVDHTVSLEPDPSTAGSARNITIDADHKGRALEFTAGWSSVDGVRIINGFTTAENGGGIRVGDGGFLYLRDSAVTNSQAYDDGSGTGWGGGVFNAGELHGTNVTLSDDVASGQGAPGHDAFGGGIATVDQGTPAETYLINATVSGNSAVGIGGSSGAGAAGGGVYTDANSMTTAVSSTIANNGVTGALAHQGGGNVFDQFPVVDGTYLTNTIVADGGSTLPGTSNCAVGGGGQITSRGGNLEDHNQCGLDQPSDHVNTPVTLGALANNGGPVDTRKPAPVFPAMDGGMNFPCNVFDARGLPRKVPADPTCDVGALELQPSEIPSTQPGGGQSGGAPRARCKLVAGSSKVKRKKRTLRLTATCDRAAALSLAGKITAKLRHRHSKGRKHAKKRTSKTFLLGQAAGKATQPGRGVTFTVKLPKGAISLLAKKRATESIAFVLSAKNAGGTSTATANVRKLALAKSRKKKHKHH